MSNRAMVFSMAFAMSATGAVAMAATDEDYAASASNFTFENDVFFGEDRYYTNGVQFEKRYRWALTTAKDLELPILNRACTYFSCEGYQLRARSHKLGQLMYTPSDIAVSSPQPEDRPWAGLLYYAQDNYMLAPDGNSLTKFTLQVGVKGPASLAEKTQKAIHKIINSQTPQGWSNQGGSELGLMLAVERRIALKNLSGGSQDGWQWRGAGSWGAAGGNIMTYGAVGLALTFGKGLPNLVETQGDIDQKMVPVVASPMRTGAVSGSPDFAQPLTSTPSPLNVANDKACLFSWLECTATAEVEARLMAYNAFLDGPLFRDGPKVKSRPLVVDASLTLLFRFPRTATKDTGPLFVQFKATRRSPEFRSSRAVKSQSFGALTIGCDFF